MSVVAAAAVEVVQKGRSIPFLMSEIKPLMQFAGFTADQMQMVSTPARLHAYWALATLLTPC